MTFDQIIAPGAKDFDFAINQVSITEERRANLDFSSSYYDTAQAVVTVEGSPVAGATTLAELAGVRIGAMVGTTSAQIATESIAPTTPVQQFNDNDQVKQALTAGLVDAIVVDLPTACSWWRRTSRAASWSGSCPPGTPPTSSGSSWTRAAR